MELQDRRECGQLSSRCMQECISARQHIQALISASAGAGAADTQENIVNDATAGASVLIYV